ncbi:hypothetical protein GALMADRAFT_217303 [Galerina marginata CBS 339.88]|uniref:F-box domain-containing protein n=1 Tax=Galerina marginata (strain CBS 339.88) TaxID=685588 RepID=A0A067S525_GALM3|nr:hypothetical protein GALMADRAFT_217303 [Galerina marginata CBS 339.88]
MNTNINTDTMEFDKIPDDIWISIFECVDSPAQLAVLMMSCRRFRAIASRLLLRDIRWTAAYSTRRNLEAWKGVYRGMEPLPRRLTVGVSFDLGLAGEKDAWSPATSELRLYDMIHSRIPSFTGLVELVLDGTTISPYTYSVLAALPALRSLSVLNCTFSRLRAPGSAPLLSTTSYYASFLYHQQQQAPLAFPFSALPLTHLSLHNPKSHLSNDGYAPYHPINLITAATLTSLSITWTEPLAALYAHVNWPLPALRELEVVMPTLTRDLVDSLVNFVDACTLGPRISLCIQHHNLSDTQMSSVHIPLAGVWRYEGPLNLQVASFCSPTPARGSPSAPAATLTTVVMTEPLGLISLLSALEKLPRALDTLDVQLHDWDIELLFAISQLFPDIRELVVRYGMGVLPSDFFVTLGSNILYNLPHLHTLKLITNDACSGDRPTYAQTNGGANGNPHFGFHNWVGGNGPNANANTNGGGNGNNNLHPFMPLPQQQQNQQLFPHLLPTALPLTLASFASFSSDADSDSDDGDFPMSFSPSPSPSSPLSILSSHTASFSNPTVNQKEVKLQHGDLKDYLIGWNRYCRSLRRVQLDRDVYWGRKWEGDAWVVGFEDEDE